MTADHWFIEHEIKIILSIRSLNLEISLSVLSHSRACYWPLQASMRDQYDADYFCSVTTLELGICILSFV